MLGGNGRNKVEGTFCGAVVNHVIEQRYIHTAACPAVIVLSFVPYLSIDSGSTSSFLNTETSQTQLYLELHPKKNI